MNKNYLKNIKVRSDIDYEYYTDPFQLYIKCWNKIPNRFCINLYKNKTEAIQWEPTFNKIKTLLETFQFQISLTQNLVFFPDFNDNFYLSISSDNNDNLVSENTDVFSRSLEAFDFTNKIFVVIARYFIMFYYDNDIEELKQQILDICNQHKTQIKTKNKVNLITQKRDYLDLINCDIDCNKPIDLNLHYNDSFKSHYKIMIDFLNNKQSGLIVLNGEPGTGKTNLIRHLIGTCENQYIIVPNTLMESIANPQFTSFILEHKDSVLVLEDCETLLMERENSYLSNGVSNILNITDGLYSDIFNIKIIATFNTGMENIDSALLREGRLITKYTFEKLSLEKTNNLLSQLNKPKSKVELTLAQIYNDPIEELDQKKPRKIGF